MKLGMICWPMIICTKTSFKFQLSAQNERKSLQAQITNERILAADQSRTYEKEIGRLSKEIEDFEVDRCEMIIEKVSARLLLRAILLIECQLSMANAHC